MTVTFKRLVTGTLDSTPSTPLYTATSVNTQIDALAFNNTSGAAVTVDVWTTSGGAPNNQNLILTGFSVPAGVTKRAWEVGGQVIPNGASLYARASSANVVIAVCSGREQAA